MIWKRLRARWTLFLGADDGMSTVEYSTVKFYNWVPAHPSKVCADPPSKKSCSGVSTSGSSLAVSASG